MINGLIGRKLGMTQIFSADGHVVPVTVLQVGPCLVTQIRTRDKDGYSAVQLGFVEPVSTKRIRKPAQGHFKKASIPPLRKMREFAVTDDTELKLGQRFQCDLFAAKEKVDITSVSKGKGFAGVVKRHHFGGGAATHGSMFHRAPGSIGGSSFPSRVFPGMRAAGRMGGERVTVRNLTVVDVDLENNLLLVEGAVPGARGGYVEVRKARAGHGAKPIRHR